MVSESLVVNHLLPWVGPSEGDWQMLKDFNLKITRLRENTYEAIATAWVRKKGQF